MPLKKIDMLRNEILIDDEFSDLLYQFSWYKDNFGYVNCKLKEGGHIKLHQLILGKAPEKMVIDHKNGNKLDNRKENLHFVSYSYNIANRKKKSNSNQEYKGIQLLPSGKYRAKGLNGKHLGIFYTAIEAHRKYLQYIQEYLGEKIYVTT